MLTFYFFQGARKFLALQAQKFHNPTLGFSKAFIFVAYASIFSVTRVFKQELLPNQPFEFLNTALRLAIDEYNGNKKDSFLHL